jgi:hypothetical protein
MMHTRFVTIILLVVILTACSSATQSPLPRETLQPIIAAPFTKLPSTSTLEPKTTPTPSPTTDPTIGGSNTSTILKFTFPFEPAPPGYLVDVKSKVFTANLMCDVENGEILNLDENSDDTKRWGQCDTSSMTLNVLIPDQMTVTVILGGFPLVDEVTKSPNEITEQQAEYYFESSLQ